MFRWVMTAVGQPLERQELVLDAPRPGEVTVQVEGCGVCHTDLGYLYDGVRPNHALPLTLGHEIAGRVIAAGDGAQHWVGQAVVVPAVVPCGECDACRRGKESICLHQKMPGNDIHGGYATHVNVPAHGLCPVNEKKLAQAGLTLADVAVVADAVTTPYQAVLQAELAAGQLAIVVGLGGVGGYCGALGNYNGLDHAGQPPRRQYNSYTTDMVKGVILASIPRRVQCPRRQLRGVHRCRRQGLLHRRQHQGVRRVLRRPAAGVPPVHAAVQRHGQRHPGLRQAGDLPRQRHAHRWRPGDRHGLRLHHRVRIWRASVRPGPSTARRRSAAPPTSCRLIVGPSGPWRPACCASLGRPTGPTRWA
jgi:hypothetical protein